MKPRILIAAGGSGGHITPAIALAKEFISKNCQVLYVGNQNSLEEELVKEQQINFKAINVQKLYRNFTFKHLLFPFKFIKSIIRSRQIISEFKPQAFIGVGGFVSGPVAIAASLKKIPIFLQEQNSVPGLTNRFIGKKAQKIFLGIENSYFPPKKTILTGNPITLVGHKQKIAYEKYSLDPNNKTIFVLGGSQGSYFINKLIDSIIPKLLQNKINLIWQVGNYRFQDFSRKWNGQKGIYTFDFSKNIEELYNSSSLVIARAGALSLAEIETKQLPAILIPLPSAADNHQFFNANALQKEAIILPQSEVDSNILWENIKKELDQDTTDLPICTRHLNAAKTIVENILRRI
ncbi:MAG: undecaprenyldiphospho-muramoylpentapeptide beta-N-acetylglucosaminyltransferase [Thermotogota bacterium]|nr:undecaprenyldiphospho-muramoylpentapeptide beta-N-acetylglucosaminyltransferase [Thermotogota bacterium]